MEGIIPECGESIQPSITRKQLNELALELYGLEILDARSLGSFDDQNFHIKTKLCDGKNPHISEELLGGFVLKIVNTHASARPATYDMQTKAMFHLLQNYITCPEPVKTIDGEYFQMKTFHLEDEDGNKKSDEERKHLVCLLTYVPGDVLNKHPDLTKEILLGIGKFAGKVTAAFRTFDHPVLSEPSRIIWDLRNSPQVRKFLHATVDPEQYKLIVDVLEAFEKNVIQNYPNLQPGVIHGDLHDMNLLYRLHDDQSLSYAVIDFGDLNKSFLAFELAIMMMGFMCTYKGEDFLEAGGALLRGFSKFIPLNDHDFRLLRYMVMMRYAAYIAVSNYTCLLEPHNAEYVNTWAERAWSQLKYLWTASVEEIDRAWRV